MIEALNSKEKLILKGSLNWPVMDKRTHRYLKEAELLTHGFSRQLLRTFTILTAVLTLSSCGQSINELSAETSLGSANPPLAPVEQRYPGFKQIQAEVAEKIIPVVVSITSAKVVQVPQFDPFEFFFGPRGQQQPQEGRRVEGMGSGVIVSADGYILTNNHVVEGADDLTVALSDDREFTAKIIGTDPPTDLAVIKIEGAKDLPVAYLGDSEKLRIGESVLAVGSPFGLTETVTSGIVSAIGRQNVINGAANFENFIQTDAAINPGNSGGPLVDLNGAVVGINSAIYSRSGGNQGVGFAIPVNMAKDVARTLINEGKVSRGYLGVNIRDVEGDLAQALEVKPGSGVLVDNVLEDSPAASAGIQAGDIITSVGGEKVTSAEELRNKVAAIKPGTKTRFAALREGKSMTFEVELMERPMEQAQMAEPSDDTKDRTGLSLQNLTPQLREQLNIPPEIKGVIIVAIDPSSPAAKTRLAPRDVILEVARQPIASVSDFQKAIAKVSGNTVLLRVQREDVKFFSPLVLNTK